MARPRAGQRQPRDFARLQSRFGRQRRCGRRVRRRSGHRCRFRRGRRCRGRLFLRGAARHHHPGGLFERPVPIVIVSGADEDRVLPGRQTRDRERGRRGVGIGIPARIRVGNPVGREAIHPQPPGHPVRAQGVRVAGSSPYHVNLAGRGTGHSYLRNIPVRVVGKRWDAPNCNGYHREHRNRQQHQCFLRQTSLNRGQNATA